MYDENKWSEGEKKQTESVIDSTAEVVEGKEEASGAEPVKPEPVKPEPVKPEQAQHTSTPEGSTQVDSGSGTYRWSKYQDQQGQNRQTGYEQGYGQQGQYGDQQQYNNQQGQQQYNSQQGYQQYNNQQYRSPYPNGYDQNPDGNHQPQGGQNHQPQGGQNRQPKKKGSFVKKTALIAAGALLFGAVSGTAMFGVNRVAEIIFPHEAGNRITEETQAALENTPVIPEGTSAAVENTSTGVVIEDVSPIVDAAMPSVVAITNTTLYKGSTWFGQTQTYEVPSSGSGIIVGENETELLVVTNNHVIEDSTSISVTFIDETTVDAAIKGTDSASDLAVIAIPLDKISAETKTKIKAATIGDSDSLRMGQGVIAIGNALGLGQSVTVGHVSALNREITVEGITKTVIQTDAAINPGNSGGALLNSKGELIGINEAKYSDESVEGVGYAIPISFAKDIIEDLKLRTTKIEVDESEQGYLGIQVQNIDSMTARMYGMPEGVYVYKITENSAAADSDLREKDIITEFDGERVRTNADLSNLLTYYKAGTTVKVTVQSLENGEYVEREVEITLKNRPQEEETQEQPRP